MFLYARARTHTHTHTHTHTGTLEQPDIIDNAYVIVEFENGVRALLDLCMFAENSLYQVCVVGVGGWCECEFVRV
jgi:myo-inositol 2-dehydrogenase / D-chiro-inositol 1-dehydrogenase